MTNNQIQIRRPIPPSPIHPMAALATVVLDNVFFFVDFIPVLGSIALGTVGFVTTSMVQRYLSKDSWGESLAKGLVMGVVAGVPFPVTGTAIGVPLLAWAGLHEWIKLPAPKETPSLSQPEIIEGEVKEIEK